MNFIILMGVSGSGKTTVGRLLAAELGWPFFDADDLHPPANLAKMAGGNPLNDEDRAAWLAALQALIHQCLLQDLPGVLACSALKQKYRDRLVEGNPGAHFVYLRGDYPTILERMRSRGDHYMKPDMLASQFEALQEPQDGMAVDICYEPREIVAQIIAGMRIRPAPG
jgi:gluconokinase